jgi:fibronectin type 3 domain-containing protein
VTLALSGTGVQPPVSHSASLSWSPSTSTVVGYNLYRGTVSGGPYSLLNGSLIPSTTYLDTGVQAGSTYFYVATAVDSSNVESPYSNQISALVP